MPKDIFNLDSNIQGAWAMDKAIVQFNTGDASSSSVSPAALIAIGFQLQYQRQITPFRPINKEGTYLVGGRGTGQITINALIGPDSAIKAFVETYGDICKAAKGKEPNHLTIRPGGFNQCGDETKNTQPTAFQCYGVAMQSLSLNVQQIGDLSVVQSGIQMLFTTLEITGGSE
jgi:hypothetical protein